MEATALLIPATSITAVCLYAVGYSLWWVLVVPVAALVMWMLFNIYQRSAQEMVVVVTFSVLTLQLGVFAYFSGVVSLWTLGISAGFIALGSLCFAICSCCQQDEDRKHHHGSTHNYAVPSYRDRTADERVSLLPSYSRLPTETPSRIVSSQSSYTPRSSFGGTPRVLHTAPDSSFRVIVDPGLLRYSTPTIAVDPRLQHYTTQCLTPTIPLPAVVDTRRTLLSNTPSTSLMATAERQFIFTQAARNSSQFARNIHEPIHAPIPAPIPACVSAPIPTPIPARVPARVPAPIPTPIPARIPARVPAPIPTPTPARIPARIPAPIPVRIQTRIQARIPVPIPARILASVARQEIDGLFLHEAVAAEVDERYPYDQQIKTENNPHSKIGLVKGYFKCYKCKAKKHQLKGPRTWDSNAICVEVWMSSSGRRYRTRLHSQMCANCNTVVEPEVIKDDYVTMVVKVLDRWTGQTSVVKPRQKSLKTGPHRTDKCNACLKGICPLKPV
ncbi:MAG: hypothetical protein J3R72DRAFT_433176, partial [Linnemannia gamsii]